MPNDLQPQKRVNLLREHKLGSYADQQQSQTQPMSVQQDRPQKRVNLLREHNLGSYANDEQKPLTRFDKQSRFLKMVKEGVQGTPNALKHSVTQGLQKTSEMFEGLLNSPSYFYEAATGKKGYRVPESNVIFNDTNDMSDSAKFGRSVGNFLPEAALSYVTAGLVPTVPGNSLSAIANNSLRVGGAEALQGFLTNNENRLTHAGVNGALGAGLTGLGGLYNKAAGSSDKAIAKQVAEEGNFLKNTIGKDFEEPLKQAEQLGANQLLQQHHSISTPQGAKNFVNNVIPDLSSGDKEYLRGLEEFLINPNPKSLHEAQSDIGKLIKNYSKRPDTVHNKLIIKNSKQLQSQLRQGLDSSIEKTAGIKAKELHQSAREAYPDYMEFYGGNEALKNYLKKPNATSQKALVKSLLDNERFLINVGQNHEGLMDRKWLSDNKWWLGAGATLAGTTGGLTWHNLKKEAPYIAQDYFNQH